jgi:hypothetical protein
MIRRVLVCISCLDGIWIYHRNLMTPNHAWRVDLIYIEDSSSFTLYSRDREAPLMLQIIFS